MNTRATNCPHSAPYEQGGNPVETGFHDVVSVAELIRQQASGWDVRERLDALLLQALCSLTVATMDSDKPGFTPYDLAEEVGNVRGRIWVDPANKDEIAKKVRDQWKLLSKLWKAKHEGITQALRDAGVQSTPVLDRIEGGGTGNTTRYLIRLEEAERSAVDTVLPEQLEIKLAVGEIRYICEDVKDAWLIARIFARGFEMTGWQRWAFILVFSIGVLLIISLVLIVSISLTTRPPLNDFVYLFVGVGIIIYGLWYGFGSILRLPDDRISSAPEWMQSASEDRLLEWRCPPRFPVKMIKAVLYSAHCPICGGKVSARSGGAEFKVRVVGRCKESPLEHVFSFDHVTRLGKSLRT